MPIRFFSLLSIVHFPSSVNNSPRYANWVTCFSPVPSSLIFRFACFCLMVIVFVFFTLIFNPNLVLLCCTLSVIDCKSAYISTVCGPAQSPLRCTKCNSPPINGQCTQFVLFDVALQSPLHPKGLMHSNCHNVETTSYR